MERKKKQKKRNGGRGRRGKRAEELLAGFPHFLETPRNKEEEGERIK